jgi:3-dehydroquinate synthase
MERIPVTAPTDNSNDYDIVIAAGLLAQIKQHIQAFGLDAHTVIATNPTVARLYGYQLQQALPNAHIALMQDGEQYKTLATTQGFYDQLLELGADRHSTILALGGGVLGDVAGFVAATYMRGVRLVQVPTTLLAMVDSSVGGKVGVDLPQGKNLVGAFKQPAVVLIDPTVLESLPLHEWRAGMAEVIKHGLLADETLLDARLHAPEHAAELVQRAAQVKVAVVQQDPYERGIRANLNLGHTFAHAIEKVTHYAWAHGYAVGFGLLAAAKLSHVIGLCDKTLVDRVSTVLEEVRLPRRLDGLDPDAIYDAMKTDKKWKSGVSRFVLLEGMNAATIVEDVPREAVVGVLRALA